MYDKTQFKDLKPTKVSKVRITNGCYISAKGKWTMVMSTSSGTKTISYVPYGPNIEQKVFKG